MEKRKTALPQFLYSPPVAVCSHSSQTNCLISSLLRYKQFKKWTIVFLNFQHTIDFRNINIFPCNHPQSESLSALITLINISPPFHLWRSNSSASKLIQFVGFPWIADKRITIKFLNLPLICLHWRQNTDYIPNTIYIIQNTS